MWGRLIIVTWAICFLLSMGAYDANAGTQRSLDSTDILMHFHGTDSTSNLGVRISSLGDINSDGFDDITMSSYSPLGTYIFYGGDPVDSLPDMFIAGAYGPASAIDVTGDGINDIVVADVFGPSAEMDGRVYFYRGYGDSLGSVPFDSIYPDEPLIDHNYFFGAEIRAAYVDADSLGDLLVSRPDHPTGGQLLYYTGAPTRDTVADWSFTILDHSHYFRQGFGFIDYDGDSQLDAFIGLRGHLDSVGYVYVFLGPDFGATPDVIIAPPEGVDWPDRRRFAWDAFNVGDVDGDGWDDLEVTYSRYPLIYRCGPAADTLFDWQLDQPTRGVASAGDVNGDGDNDLVVGAILSEFGGLGIYLGGREFDVYLDDWLQRSDLPPLFLDMIGYRTTGAGDFNGDGIDDFMFSCQNFSSGEPNDVFVVGGSRDIVTEVSDDNDLRLPETFALHQNFPNPFNPSTTIEFSLSRRELVTLEVLNLLGQQVKALLKDKQLPAGNHSCTWDGTDAGGNELASGVYLSRLKASGETQTRKMMLLR